MNCYDDPLLAGFPLSLNNLDGETRKKVLKAWLFKNKILKFEKLIPLKLSEILFGADRFLYEYPEINYKLPYDPLQIFDFNFKHVCSNFSKKKWQNPRQGEKNSVVNKSKIINFSTQLMFNVFNLLKNNFVESLNPIKVV